MKAVRDNNGRYLKGCSGNPGGYSRALIDSQHLFRKHTQEAIDCLLEVMRCGQRRDRFLAAKEILNRGWGKRVSAFRSKEEEAEQVLVVDPTNALAVIDNSE